MRSPVGDSSVSPVAPRLKRPTRESRTGRAGPRATTRGSPPLLPYLVLLPVGFAEPGRSPGLLVSSYLAVSPLPRRTSPPWRFVFCGTFPTRNRAVGVTHHRALRSPDFPPRQTPARCFHRTQR